MPSWEATRLPQHKLCRTAALGGSLAGVGACSPFFPAEFYGLGWLTAEGFLVIYFVGRIRDIQGNFGARAFLAPDGQDSSHHAGPFLHGRQPHAQALPPRLRRIKAFAVVLDQKRDSIVVPGNGNQEQVGLGMLADIGEGFLNNAVDGDLGRQGKQGRRCWFLGGCI